MENGMEQQLWDFIDGRATAAERSAVEKHLAENRDWREKYEELRNINELMKSIELEQPSLRFTRNVMEEIAKQHIAPATRKYINNRIIFSIAAFFITSIIGFVIYGIAQIDWSSGQGDAVKGIDFTQVNYGKIFNNDLMNIFMMANVVLGLMFLDRYLNNKKKKYLEEA